jgi:hypothetical protein
MDSLVSVIATLSTWRTRECVLGIEFDGRVATGVGVDGPVYCEDEMSGSRTE